MNSRPTLKPLSLLASLPYFALPALGFVISVYGFAPFLQRFGVSEFVAFLCAMTMPLMLLLLGALIALRLEGYTLTWVSIKERFRLRPMTGRDWLWTLVSLVGMFIGLVLFGMLAQLSITHGWIPLPGGLPSFLDPLADPRIFLDVARVSSSGTGSSIALTLFLSVLLFFNIIGEEFWWRGLILPRQELVHGKTTWFIHGTMWTLFHAFKYWHWILLFPVCIILSFVAQRRRNTWPGIVTHFVVNGIGLIPVFIAVLKD